MMMIFNPALWFMIWFAVISFGPDNDLRLHGENVQATVKYVVHRTYKGSPTTDVYYNYDMGGQTYSGRATVGNHGGSYLIGQRRPVWVLPSDPSYAENLGDNPGAKQSRDTFYAFWLVISNLILEAFIWVPAGNDKRLAEQGYGALARVLDKREITGTKGQKSYELLISFYLNKDIVKRKISVSCNQFAAITRGDVEPILYTTIYDAQLYRFCRYQPVLRAPRATLQPPQQHGTPQP
jgi:hypothetical protein